MIIAGEPSGDMYGAELARAMRCMDKSIQFKGMGGNCMAEAGVLLVEDAANVAVVGITEVVPGLGRILAALKSIRRTLRTWRPDLLILIDFPDFNLRVAKTAQALKIPILYYICPQVWAWRKGRVRLFEKLIDQLAVILPFEEAFWRKNGVKATYVGHPLMDQPEFNPNRSLKRVDFGPSMVGLLPGSRKKELVMHLPIIAAAAKELSQKDSSLKFCVALLGKRHEQWVKDYLAAVDMGSLFEVTTQGARVLFPKCDLVIAASGTVTLEAALAKVPTVVVYKVSPISFWVAKALIRVRYISLPNLIAGQPIFPELIQKKASPENIARSALVLLENKNLRQRMIRQMEGVQRRLGSGGAAQKVARIAMQMIPYESVKTTGSKLLS